MSSKTHQNGNLLALALAGIIIIGGSGNLRAINNGEPDIENQFSNVGAIVFIHPEFQIPWQTGTGTLIHKRGFLTAAHVTVALEDAVALGLLTLDDIHVSFSPDRALDPSTWLPIRAIHSHPQFRFPTGLILSDLAIVELADPVENLAPAALAPVGFLDDLNQAGILSRNARTPFVVAGYGAIRFFPERESYDNLDAGIRFWAVGQFQALRKNTLQCNQVQAPGLDNGGTCFGDSGGPNFYFLNANTPVLTSITSWGDRECVATDMRFRVDTELAQSFILGVLSRIDQP